MARYGRAFPAIPPRHRRNTTFVTLAIGQASTTNTAQPIGKAKSYTLGQALETDTAQHITHPVGQIIVIGQALETDTPQALSHSKARAVGQALETDTPQAFGKAKQRAIGQASTTNTAQALSHAKARTLGQAQQTTTAQPIGKAKQRAIGQASTTVTAQHLTAVKARTVGQAQQTTLAQPIGHRRTYDLVQPAEADSANPIAGTTEHSGPSGPVLFLGDSVGWQLAGVNDIQGYGDILSQYGFPPPPGLAGLGYEVTNAAVPGSGCAQASFNDLTSITGRTYPDLFAQYTPDKVAIHFGGNNFVWSDDQQTDTEPFLTLRWWLESIAGMREILDLAVAAVGAPNVCVVGGLRVCLYGDCADPFRWSEALDTWGRYVLDTLLADYPGVQHVDCTDIAPDDFTLRQPDYIHLTDAGAHLIAQRIAAQWPALGVPTLPPTEPVQAPPPPLRPSARLKAAVHDSHEVVTRVDVYRGGVGEVVDQLAITGGTITLDAGDSTHRSAHCDSTNAAGALDPARAADILSPFTSELAIWAGVKYPDHTEELHPQGWYKVEDLDQGDDGTVKLVLFDVSKGAEMPFGNPFVTVAGADVATAIRDMLWTATPTVPCNFPVTGFAVPQLVLAETSNPWQEATTLALLSGYTLGVSRMREYTLEPVQLRASTVADWSFEEGPRANFWDMHRQVNAAQWHNHIIVRSTNTALAGVQGEAYDNDPTSPTYVGGKFGDRRVVITDSRITSPEQAQAAAEAILLRGFAGQTKGIGVGETVPFKGVPNYALDLNATARAVRGPLGLDDYVLMEHIEVPLVVGEMSARGRRSILTQSAQLTAVL